GRRILPVELREYRPGRAEGVIPAVAILQAVRDSTGRYLGVGVVEAEAEELFAYLETASPGLAGTTGLVTSDGLFLYHSEYKRDWSSLLARQSEVNLFSDFSPELAQRILEGASGTSEAERGLLVGFRPIHFGPSGAAPLALYRAVPASVVWAPVRRFLTVTLVVGVLITTLVLVVSVLAAQQFSGPILQLQRAANELARGGEPELPVVETNDEIEDLAHDFGRMATALIEHRRGLERMVEERTRELRVARTELHEVVSNARDAIIGIDTECRVRLWNRGAEELFGYPAEEAVGHDLDELILPDDEDLRRESEYVAIAARRMGSVSGLRTRRRTRCGEVIDVSLTYSPIVEEDGTFRGAAVIVRDDRMGREMEEQMRRSERLAAISIMAAGIAHELNNPLAVMANRIELMQRDIDRSGDAPAIAKDLEVLGRQIGRIKGITSDLLNFAREEDGDPVAVDMRETAERVGRLLEHTFLKKNVHLAFEIEDELPSVMGSERAIETVLVNLLINAVQATPEGGRVCVRLRRDAGEDAVVLEVEDSGTGVPDDLRTRIFQPFFTTKASAGGTGLGLAVCRAVMERHRGALTLHDAPSGGALFRAVFPLSQENT
ncbi:MAG: sensor histidine kinase, partial [Gemmatimonadetes bacterium]